MCIILVIIGTELIRMHDRRRRNILGHAHMLHRPLHTEITWCLYVDAYNIRSAPQDVIGTFSNDDTRFGIR